MDIVRNNRISKGLSKYLSLLLIIVTKQESEWITQILYSVSKCQQPHFIYTWQEKIANAICEIVAVSDFCLSLWGKFLVDS